MLRGVPPHQLAPADDDDWNDDSYIENARIELVAASKVENFVNNLDHEVLTLDLRTKLIKEYNRTTKCNEA